MTVKGESVYGGASSTTAGLVWIVSPPEPVPTPLLRTLQFVAGAGAVAAGIPYAVLRIFLNIFYSTFRVTPEEVGWDSYTVLTRFALPLAVLVLGVVYMVVGVHANTLARTGSLRGVFRTWPGRLTATAAAGVSLAMLALFAHEKSTALRRGTPLSVTIDSMLPISAPCVRAYWLDVPEPQRANLPSLDGHHELFLLGEAHGTTILYDANSDAALRVPGSRIVLQNCRS